MPSFSVCILLGYSSLLCTHSYPAGFVYIYSLFYYITGRGENIALAQAVFAALYLINLAVVMAVYGSVARVSVYLFSHCAI